MEVFETEVFNFIMANEKAWRKKQGGEEVSQESQIKEDIEKKDVKAEVAEIKTEEIKSSDNTTPSKPVKEEVIVEASKKELEEDDAEIEKFKSKIRKFVQDQHQLPEDVSESIIGYSDAGISRLERTELDNSKEDILLQGLFNTEIVSYPNRYYRYIKD